MSADTSWSGLKTSLFRTHNAKVPEQSGPLLIFLCPLAHRQVALCVEFLW
jgi:hypothetical protein